MQAKIHSLLNSSCHVKTVICPRNVSLIHVNRGPTETNGQKSRQKEIITYPLYSERSIQE